MRLPDLAKRLRKIVGRDAVLDRAEDLMLAREYADAYTQARGPQIPLVKQWVDYLEHEGKR